MTVGWSKALAVWWSAAWRGALYGMVGGFVLGAVGGVVSALVGAPPDQAALYGAAGGYVAAIPASILGLKQALSKHLASLVAGTKERMVTTAQ